MLEAWLYAQPAIAEAGMARGLALSLSIAFILCPALAWVQLTPERWLQQIQQAHQVKRLEIQQRGELAILKTRILWATQRAAVSYANLLPGEQQEVLATIKGLFMSIGDTQRDIARTLQIDADLSRTILDDDRIASDLDYVAEALTSQTVEQPALTRMRDLPAHESARVIDQAFDQAIVGRANGPSERAERAPAAYTEPHKGHTMQHDAASYPHCEEYTIAHRALPDAWTVKDLARVLSIEEPTARQRRAAWQDAGLVSGQGLSTGRYRFV